MTITHHMFALATLTLPLAAGAAPPSPAQKSIAVEVGDLDLDTDHGQRILNLRIARAATAVCKAEALRSLPQTLRNERSCLREAKASAEAIVKTLTAAVVTTSGKGG